MNKTSILLAPNGSEINEHPNRMSKSEAKISISEDEKKAVIIIQTQMEYWSTDVATNHQVTNQQPNDYKEPINNSEDKVRGYNNTVNKYMSSEMEENFIRQNQVTVILATDTSPCKGRADTYCTIYNWYNRHGVEWIQNYQSTKWQETQKCGSNEVSISNLTSWSPEPGVWNIGMSTNHSYRREPEPVVITDVATNTQTPE
jgi:hypothetical protein